MPQYRIEVVIDPTRAQRGSRQVERSLDRINDRAERMRRLVTRAFALVGVGAAIHQVAQLSDSFIDLQNRARIASDSIGGDLAGTLDDLIAVAVRTRAPVLALAGVYQRGSIAAKELNATQEELIRLAEIAGKAVAIQGGGLQTARGALTQLSQTLGQSIVRGEEFNSILEGAFPIALAAARGIERVGGSVGKLRTEIIEGRVTSEEFFRGILAGGAEIDRQFALTTPTIGQAFTVLRTGLIRSAEALNEISAPLAGFIRDVGLAVAVLAGVERQQIVTEEQTERIEAITTTFQVLRVAVISVAVVLLGRYLQALAASATASIVAQRLVVIHNLALARIAGTSLAAATGTLVLARATTALGASMRLLGGPVGIALLAAYGIYEFASSVERAREELGASLGPLEDYIKSLEDLTTAQRAVQRLDIEIGIDEAQGEIDRLQGGLEDIQRTLRRGFIIAGSEIINLPAEDIQELNDELLRGQADIDLYTQRLQDLQARLGTLGRFDIEIEIDEALGEIARLEGRIEEIQRITSRGFVVMGAVEINVSPDYIEDINKELLRAQDAIALETQKIQDLEVRLGALGGPVRPELAPEEDSFRPNEQELKRSLARLAKLHESADDRIAASSLSRIDQITRREEIGVAQAIEAGRTRGVSAEQVEAAITRIRVAGALERQGVIENEAERERQAEGRRVERERRAEEGRIERVQRSNDQAVRSITQSLVSLQSEYDQAVIAAIQKAEQTAAALDTESAAYERNLETVRRVLNEETRLAGVVEQERIAATERRADQEISLEHLRALARVRQAQIDVGLASRDAAREAELWAEIQRRAIDLTAEGAEEALASIDAVVARARQLASDDPLAGLRIGLEAYASQLPSVAQQINDTVQSTFQNAEDALLNFATTGKLNFSDFVDSLLADLARIALRQALLGPISQALGSVIGGAFGGSTAASPIDTIAVQDGGLVTGPGGPRSDSILARLSNGEFVVNAAATRANITLLHAINSAPAFQSGGMVRPAAAVPTSQGERGVSVQVIDNRTTSADTEGPQVSEGRGPDGERQIRVIIEDTVDQANRGGRFDSSLGSRYGVRPSIAPR